MQSPGKDSLTIAPGEEYEQANKEQSTDSLTPGSPGEPIEKINSPGPAALQDSVVLALSRQVLIAFSQHNPRYLLNFLHPEYGIRFSPYGYVDTLNDVVMDKATLLKYTGENPPAISWGSYDGSGEKIIMSFPAYINRFVYDVDFLHAPQIKLNGFIGKGNSMNNLENIYPGAEFVEYHFPGFDKKYEGMDWRSLRLVFKKMGKRYYLLGIIHDQWTI